MRIVAPAGVLGSVSLEALDIQVPDLAALGSMVALPAGVAVEGGSGIAQVRGDIDLAMAARRGWLPSVCRDCAPTSAHERCRATSESPSGPCACAG